MILNTRIMWANTFVHGNYFIAETRRRRGDFADASKILLNTVALDRWRGGQSRSAVSTALPRHPKAVKNG